MSDKELQKIQDLQFTNIQIANDLLKKFHAELRKMELEKRNIG
jgi:hypothetical protein